MTAIDPDSASAQLRVIRSLMERATIYRSLSAPTALVGGLLSFCGLGATYAAEHFYKWYFTDGEFLALWLTVLVLTGATNAYVLWREAQRRGMAFFSAGMKCAIKSIVPSLFCGGVIILVVPALALLAIFWILFYGLALLAMQHFAPRSIVVLGWCFVLTALGIFICGTIGYGMPYMNDALLASWMMALTFGLYHVVYAIAVWAMGGESADAPAVSPNEAENV
jgi:hypothetical protein